MTEICYIHKDFKDARLDIIVQANEIIEEYQQDGYDLTLRQLYYQFVSKDLIPNTERSYKNLGTAINDGRLAGLISWEAIVDRTRNVRTHPTWDDPREILQSAARSYAEDLWADQTYRPEVWIEKEALVGVIERSCNDLQVPYYAVRGYNSQSQQWRSGRKALNHRANEQRPVIIYLGDHDPSGIDMVRDLGSRFELFSGRRVPILHIALTLDQIDQYAPPPNPTKVTDSRAKGYMEEYGNSSWELDALSPPVIDKLVRDEIKALIDDKPWYAARQKQEAERAKLVDLINREYGEAS